MNYLDTEQPPLKKRRFFTEESPSPQDEDSQLPLNENADAIDGFDKKTFESFVGEAVSDEMLQRLRQSSGHNMEQAINMYLDGSWEKAVTSSGSSSATAPDPMRMPLRDLQPGEHEKSTVSPTRCPLPRMECMPESRYVGAFGVGAWATRSGTNIIKHGDTVKIERTKIKPPTKIGRGGRVIQPAKGSAARMRTDIIVRFTTVKGEEIGRLPKETAFWVSTLMDQNICRFEGICVFIPDRVRVNDTIYLQLRCFFLKRAFDSRGLIKPLDNNRTTGIFEEKETTEEKDLRLRQVALVKLFDEVNLHPCTSNETTAKHKREGILQAAEVAEQYEQDVDGKKPKLSADVGSSTPEDSEPEEGKELEQDQLDSLYKKAQSFDFDTPTREPANTFAMKLRKYQKQALHWMISKEKDEKSENKELSMHPLWEEYEWPVKDVDDNDVPGVINQRSFYVNPYSGELSLDFPVQEQHCLGGILADGKRSSSYRVTLADGYRNGSWENNRDAESNTFAPV
jgi:DNA repair protein RAD5